MQEMQKQQSSALTSKLTDIQSKIKGASQGSNPDISKMPGMDQILEKWDNKSLSENGSLDMSSNNPQLTSMTQDTERQVDGAVQGFCKGFQAEKGGYKKTMAQQ